MESKINNQLPDGLIWPRFEDGSLVNIGDCIVGDGGKSMAVTNIQYRNSGYWFIGDGYNGFFINKNGEYFKRPFTDSWEKLEKDILEDYFEYWHCAGFRCDCCPNIIKGSTPSERYRTNGCNGAKLLDIVERAKKIAEHENGSKDVN